MIWNSRTPSVSSICFPQGKFGLVSLCIRVHRLGFIWRHINSEKPKARPYWLGLFVCRKEHTSLHVVLADLASSTIAPLQRVQNAAARLILRLDRRSHITSALRELHWLPVKYRIQFKVALFVHKVTAQRCWSYVADLVTFYTSDPQRRSLRSECRPVQPSSDKYTLISDDARSLSAARMFGTVCYRLYAPCLRLLILHFC